MGYYIQGPTSGKAKHIVENFGGQIIPQPKDFSIIPQEKALICVVNNNGLFDAAGYCYSQSEFSAFNDPSDNRPKTWVLMDKNVAEKESGRKR